MNREFSGQMAMNNSYGNTNPEKDKMLSRAFCV